VTPPIYTTSTFEIETLGTPQEYDYTRSGNPTRRAVEDVIASLEKGTRCYVTSSGMSAISATLLLLKSGDHLLAPKDIYGGTFRLLSSMAPKLGIEVDFLQEPNNLDEIKAKIKSNTKMLWIETPSNPLLKITDIESVCNFTKGINPEIICVSDNTFLSPYFQKPLILGCDIVVHSTTKYLNGHSDVIGGAIVCKDEKLAKEIGFIVNCMGLAAAPFDSWLVLRGIRTLALRMDAHEKNAGKIFEFLRGSGYITKVFYPGDPENPQKDLIKKQMTGYGGMLSFNLDLSLCDIHKFFSALKYFKLAVSLGGYESLIAQPWSMSHAAMTQSARESAGIDTSLIRISAGIESSEDLISDLGSALEACCCC
jgi:cystathionine beta-lyase/cystathionine gamma-synthase